MLISKTLLNVELLTSTEMFKLIRRHGHQLWVVYTAIQVLQHEKDGEDLSQDDFDMIGFFTGLDIEQVTRAVKLLLENNIISGTDAGFYNQEIKNDLEKIISKRNIYQENAKKRWNKKESNTISEDNKESAKAMQLHSNSNADLLNMNTEHEYELDKNKRELEVLENFESFLSPEYKKYIPALADWVKYWEIKYKDRLKEQELEHLLKLCFDFKLTENEFSLIVSLSISAKVKNILWNKIGEVRENLNPNKIKPFQLKSKTQKSIDICEEFNQELLSRGGK